MNLANDRALAVDPVDLSVYTGNGSHGFGGAGTVYKYGADGSFGWTNTISHAGGCNFYFVSGAAVDATSANPGVVWTETGCFGGFAKTTRDTGGQQWSSNANDIGRASIDPVNGQIYAITNSHYNTIYSVTANGGNVSSTSSCEGYTDLNPADGMLYRGGNAASNGCGLTLYQVNKSNLTMPNWSMDLSAEITSFDSLAVQPWSCGYIYIGSTADSKIVVVDPATQTVVTRFNTAIGPARIAVNPINGNLYVADNSSHFVYAYGPTGSFVWMSPDLGGPVYNVAAPRVAEACSPTVGNYPATSVVLSGNATVTPDAVPTNTTSINVSTSTNFQGTFAADSTTGIVLVTDAHPAGIYTVTVTAFGPGGTTTKTFMLTVTDSTACGAGYTDGFTNAADVNAGSILFQ